MNKIPFSSIQFDYQNHVDYLKTSTFSFFNSLFQDALLQRDVKILTIPDLFLLRVASNKWTRLFVRTVQSVSDQIPESGSQGSGSVAHYSNKYQEMVLLYSLLGLLTTAGEKKLGSHQAAGKS